MAKWSTAENCDQYPIDDPVVIGEDENGVYFSDPVHAPVHYNTGSIECIDYIKSSMSLEEYRGYLRGNVIKYQHRHKYKGKPAEDLAKAGWYIGKLKETYQE